jgi:nitrous oxidase accessory protein
MSARLIMALVAGSVVASAPAHAATLVVGQHGATLQATLDAASDGDIVEVPEGTWPGPVTVSKRITLRGTGGTIDGGGEGTVLIVTAARAIVENLTVRGSGSDLSGLQPDTCVWVEESAADSVMRGNHVEDCAFGIWINKAPRAQVLDNEVIGRSDMRPTDRGNGIHLFDSTELVVRGNTVTGARDGIYVLGVDDSLIEGNTTKNQRYGIHYMYSIRNTLHDNVSQDNLNGFALMQSRELVVTNNRAISNERHGILFRDATDCVITGNELRGNGEGFFFFSSAENQITNNRLVENKVGAKIWAGSQRNDVSGNAFIANAEQIFYVGAEDLVLGKEGDGNYWSDYVGWDQSGDGIGDRPYRMASFASHLVYKYPAAAMLMHSPGVELLSHLEDQMPLLTVPTVVDESPLMRDPTR